MKVINIFGGPGTGKSTAAYGLAYLMKCQGYSVELATEFAKDLYYEHYHSTNRETIFSEQDFITAQQKQRLKKLEWAGVEWVVTDSPILLGSIYAPVNYPQSWHDYLLSSFNEFDNVNVMLTRVYDYVSHGRNQTNVEADQLAARVKNILFDHQLSFITMDADESAPHKILRYLNDSPK